MLGGPVEVVLSALELAPAGRFAEVCDLFVAPLRELVTSEGLEALTERAKRINGPDLSPSTPASELPLGAPASYWLDLRDYDPAGLAAKLGKPMLILQGGPDYQSRSPTTSRSGKPRCPTAPG
jgi:hypothetical protein